MARTDVISAPADRRAAAERVERQVGEIYSRFGATSHDAAPRRDVPRKGFDLSGSRPPASGPREAEAPRRGFDLSATDPKRNDDKPSKIMPFRLYVDDREMRAGWTFTGMHGDSSDDYRRLIVGCQTVRLATGDYAIEGWEDLICVERKSIDDLYGSCTHGRHRFEAEHHRMEDMIRRGGAAWVIIEGHFDDQPLSSGASPRAIQATALSWPQRFGVPWIFAGSRQLAMEAALWHFRRAWRTICKPAP